MGVERFLDGHCLLREERPFIRAKTGESAEECDLWFVPVEVGVSEPRATLMPASNHSRVTIIHALLNGPDGILQRDCIEMAAVEIFSFASHFDGSLHGN